MANKLTLFILDDNIHKSQDFVNRSVYDSKIDSESLRYLTDSFEWKGQHSLRELTSAILNSSHSKSGNLTTYGFTHPSICLDEIDKGLMPDIIIFDWEYGGESNKESSKWLTEILELTGAFVFVYSQVRDSIPPFLNKREFDKYASHFQLFLKGDTVNSIYSSEEFILQYVLTRLGGNNIVKLQGLDISFYENGYLKSPSDILYLEKLLGRQNLLDQLKKINLSITNESIEQLLENYKVKFLFSSEKNLLITTDSNLLIEKFKPQEELLFINALKRFGLPKIKEALEVGLAKV